MSESRGPAEPVPCASCGVEPQPSGLPGGMDDDAITHCEWCGAEYPMPVQRPRSKDPADDQADAPRGQEG